MSHSSGAGVLINLGPTSEAWLLVFQDGGLMVLFLNDEKQRENRVMSEASYIRH